MVCKYIKVEGWLYFELIIRIKSDDFGVEYMLL